MGIAGQVRGGCYCGTVRFELTFPTEFVSHCHCEDCRRTHSAAFVTWTAVPLSQFRFLSGEGNVRKYESHPGIRWGFCSSCGTSLTYDCDDAPDKIYVTVASLDGPLDREPEGHVSFEEHAPWLDIYGRLPKFIGKSDEKVKESKSLVPLVVQETWTAVDQYFSESLIPEDPLLEDVLQESANAGLPAHQVSATQGRLLMLLAKMQNARKILEIGTLGGYSTIWLARGIQENGRVITLEANPKHAAVAEANFARAGLTHVIDLRQGPALETLPKLDGEHLGPFDLVFIDADKPNNPRYLDWALRLCRPGSVIIGDNVVRDGDVIDETSSDPSVIGVRQFIEALAANRMVDATAVQTVGSKGYDGFTLAVVNKNSVDRETSE